MTGSLLTADQVAALLGVPKTWVYEQSRAGRIPTVTLGRYRRYRREAVEAWVEQLEAPARAARATPALDSTDRVKSLAVCANTAPTRLDLG